MAWNTARDKLMLRADHGVKHFLADKMLVNLTLFNVVSLSGTDPALGPGARVTLHVVKHHLLERGEWCHTFCMKPEAMPSWAERHIASMDHSTFLHSFLHEVRTFGRAYLKHRMQHSPFLKTVEPFAATLLDDKGAVIEGEYILCEVGRRRALALFAARRKNSGLEQLRLGRGAWNPKHVSFNACRSRLLHGLRRLVQGSLTLCSRAIAPQLVSPKK